MNTKENETPLAASIKEAAINHVKLASKFLNQELDFSERSITLVHQSLVDNLRPNGMDDNHYRESIVAYLGETFIRNLGGRWITHPTYGTVANVGSGNDIIWVDYWVKETLKDPVANSFVDYYLSAKVRLLGEGSHSLSEEVP